MSMKSKDGYYNYLYAILFLILSERIEYWIVYHKPFFGEKEFANKEHFQKDRYDVALKGIALEGIDMKNLIDKKLFASDLTVKSVGKNLPGPAETFERKSKVGRYPSQLIGKIEVPINIAHATLSNAYIEYREHEKLSDSTGL